MGATMSSRGGISARQALELGDMLGKYAAAYVMVVETIDGVISQLEALDRMTPSEGEGGKRVALALLGQKPSIPASVGAEVEKSLRSLIDILASRMTFPSVAAQTRRISQSIEKGKSSGEIASEVRQLRLRLIDELNEREFLYIPPARVSFYTQTMLFGQEVNDRFPSALDDIECAGKCLALGEGTACVLHCMRVMEVGLKALAASLNIPYAPSWEGYLTQINARIAAKRKTKGVKWKRDEKYYSNVSGDLLTVKQAWRNPTMHVGRKYSVEEAEEIFKAVRTFMKALAKKHCEPQVKKLIKMIS
jgi:hypothetical protein